MKILKRVIIVILILFVAIQVVRPDRQNPGVDQGLTLQARTTVPAEVQAILERSCYDCHSNQTRWPWYSNIAPVSWLLADHVKDGRKELSFSEWGNYTPKKAADKLEEICKLSGNGGMPIQSYLLIHREAVLSEADKKALCAWANLERSRIGATGDKDED